MSEEKRPVHERIRAHVDATGISRKVLAENARLSEAELSKVLNGQRNLTADVFERLCRAMSVHPKFFHDKS